MYSRLLKIAGENKIMVRFLLIMGVNKKAKTLLRSLSGLAVVVASLMASAVMVGAQSNGLGVTPKETFTMNAGATASNSLFLANLNKTQPLNVHLNVVDFTYQDETGAAKLLQASDQPQTPWSLKPYITVPDNVTVPPGGSKQIPFTLKLPANIGAGTYYSAVEYTASTGSGSQQVTIAASSATLLFINVPGKATELLTMKSFGMYDTKANKFKSMFHAQPSYFSYRLANSGNLAEAPAGSVVIKNMFGHLVAKVDNANPKSQIALIGQTRRFQGCNPKSNAPEELPKDENCIPFNLKPGFYSATIAIFYGQNGQPTREIGATTHFWYLPWTFIVEVLVVLALLVYFIYRIYNRAARRR
jgi:hypothetical protein